MKIIPFVNHIKTYLPRLTDAFTDQVSVSSATSVGNLCTIVTSTPHKLATGDYVNLQNCYKKNIITSMTWLNGIVTVTTQNNHDFTQGYDMKVTVYGATQYLYNNTFDIVHTPSRKSFTYRLTGPVVSPATGSPYILDNIVAHDNDTVNRLYEVTVLNSNTFTVNLPVPYNGTFYGEMRLHKNHRVTGFLNDLNDFFVKQRSKSNGEYYDYNKPWLLITPSGSRTNKNKAQRSDVPDMYRSGEAFRLRQFGGATCYIILNTRDKDEFNIEAHDYMQELLPIFYLVLIGFRPESEIEDQVISGLILNSEQPVVFSDNRYVHSIDMEYTKDVIFQDIHPSLALTSAVNQVTAGLFSNDPDIIADVTFEN